MKHLFFLLFLIGTFLGNAQEHLNNYKYIVVPIKLDGFKKENQHQTSTLIKFLLVQNGFNAVYADALPEDLSNQRCLGLLVHLKDDSSMFVTKTTLVLKDCNGQEIFSTEQGASKKKEFKAAYNEAIKQAFESLDGIVYAYKPATQSSEPVTVSFKNDVKKLEINEIDEDSKIEQKQDAVIEQEATPEQQSYKNLEPVPSEIKKAGIPRLNASPTEPLWRGTDTAKEKVLPKSVEVFYAQELPNGYQLVDSEPKIRLKIFKSTMPNVYMAENKKGNGIVYKKDSQWFFEYYNGSTLVVEEISIKF